MVEMDLVTESCIFKDKPSIKEIIDFIANYDSSFFDNDREFCYLFDNIAINNGYTESNLPSYWSIGREIFRYKKEHNLKADTKTNQLNYAIKVLDLGKYNIKLQVPEGKKPTTAKIIETIWKNYNGAFQNDRLLVKIFDSLALNNGFTPEELPKYWNIIRAAFDFKKDKEYMTNTENIYTEEYGNSYSKPIDYRVLSMNINELNLDTNIQNKLVKANIYTVSDLLKQLQIPSNDYLKRKKDIIYNVLCNLGIEEGVNYHPAVMTIPDFYYKKLKSVLDDELIEFLSKYNFRNIGLLANNFPDVIIQDDEAMENPKVFEYINTITNSLKKYGIFELPIKLSKFQIEDLNKLTTEELLNVDYAEKIINCIEKTFSTLSSKEKDVLSARHGLYNEYKSINDENFDAELLSIDFGIPETAKTENFVQSPRIIFTENKRYTLEEIGQEFGVTRERIRQIENHASKKFNKIFQDQFQQYYKALCNLFSKNQVCLYIQQIDKLRKYESLINTIFDSYENKSFYINFSVGLIIKNGITLENLLEDDSVATDLKIKIEKYVYRDFIKIDNHRIKNNKNDILIYFLKTHCRKGVKFNNFQNLYMDFLISNGLNDRDDLLYFDNTLYNKLSVMDCLLLSPGKVIRYYDIDLAKELVTKLDLSEYKDIEISSRKLYLENLELMQEYEIENEYELHNLLKKHSNNLYIDFSRMPIINFGTPNREKQMEDLLYQLSPIKSRDFALAYEDKYGIDTKNFIANYAKSINKYLINGYYVIHTENLNNEHLEILKNKLTDDFYWKEDLENIYTSLFNDSNLRNLNAQNIKLLNYTMTSSCIYSDKFNSLADCVEHIILNGNTFNLNVQPKFKSLAVFYQVFSKLKNNMDIIEFDLGKYININKLESIGIKKCDLTNYQKKVIDFIGDKFFTVTSLRNLGFEDNKLDDLGFDDYFYSSILINSINIQYKKIQNAYLMKKDNKPFEFFDFLTYIMGKLRKIDIYDLIQLLKQDYNLDISKYKLINITKDSDLYYNPIMNKIYFDKDEFYKEISI